MEFFYFLGVVIAMGAGLGLLVMLTRSRADPGPEIPVVAIGSSWSDADGQLWRLRLEDLGIWCLLRDVSLMPRGAEGQPAYQWQLWVRAEDEEAARKALGLW